MIRRCYSNLFDIKMVHCDLSRTVKKMVHCDNEYDHL